MKELLLPLDNAFALRRLRSLRTVAEAAGFFQAFGDAGKNIKDLRRAVEIDPSNTVAVRSLALALYDQQKFEEAAQVLIQAIELKPAEERYHRLLGHCHARQEEFELAKAAYQKAILCDPDSSANACLRLL